MCCHNLAPSRNSLRSTIVPVLHELHVCGNSSKGHHQRRDVCERSLRDNHRLAVATRETEFCERAQPWRRRDVAASITPYTKKIGVDANSQIAVRDQTLEDERILGQIAM